MKYETFKEEFEGLGEISQSKTFIHQFYYVVHDNIKIQLDVVLNDYCVYKDGEMIESGLDMETAKLILKVVQPKTEIE